MDTFFLDLKYGVRSLWRDKGFALTVLLTFAVCIAANAALFAMVNSVILRPLPVADANSIVIDRKSTRLNSSHEWISYAVFCLKKKKKNKTANISHKNASVYNKCMHDAC